MKIIIMNNTLAPHLEEVIEEMKKLGTPKLHGAYIDLKGERYFAIFDGSHRTLGKFADGYSLTIEDLSKAK